MSRENVDLIQRVLGEAQHNPAALYDIVDDTARWEVGALTMPDMPPTYHGPAGIKEFFRRWVGAFDEWGYEVREAIDAGDSVVVRIHQWGRGKGSGVAVDHEFWQTWTFRHAKIIRGTNHHTKADALEAVDRSE